MSFHRHKLECVYSEHVIITRPALSGDLAVKKLIGRYVESDVPIFKRTGKKQYIGVESIKHIETILVGYILPVFTTPTPTTLTI